MQIVFWGTLILLVITTPLITAWTTLSNTNVSYLKTLTLTAHEIYFDLHAELKFKTSRLPLFDPPDSFLIRDFQAAQEAALGGETKVQVYAVDYDVPFIVSRVRIEGDKESLDDTIEEGIRLYSIITQYKTDIEDIIMEKMRSSNSRFSQLYAVSLTQIGGIYMHMTDPNTLLVQGFQQSMLTVNTGLLVFTVVILIVLIISCIWRFIKKFNVQYQINNQEELPVSFHLVSMSAWDTVIDMFVSQKRKNSLVQIQQIPYQDLEVADDNPIATGSQKEVYQVKWNGMVYALVFSKNHKELREMEVYKHMRYMHENIVQVRGYSQDPRGRQCVLMEFAKEGSLDDFLRKYRHKWNEYISHQNELFLVKLRIAQQICSGLVYMHKQGVIHRDVAARNILLFDLNPVKVKLTDFGLALITSRPQEGNNENQTVINTMRNLPIRWTPPEVIQKIEGSRWSQKSDIWSYGILVWEIFANGRIPFENLNDLTVMQKLGLYGTDCKEQDALPCQLDIPDEIYEFMKQCWKAEPSERPSAEELLQQLKQLVKHFSTSYQRGSCNNSSNNNNSDQQLLQELQLVSGKGGQFNQQKQQHFSQNQYQNSQNQFSNSQSLQRMDQSVLEQVVQDVARLGESTPPLTDSFYEKIRG